MSLPTRVRIVEAGPRDGLQNEKQLLSTDVKVELIERLVDAGLTHLDAGSFVNPKWVPQMADTEAVFAAIQRRPGVVYSALTPNLRGFERAIASGANEVAVFTAASDAFNLRNINCSTAESIERFVPLVELAQQRGVPVRAYLSCAVGCPYDGDVPPARVRDVCDTLVQMGCYEIALSDTIGVGTPRSMTAMIEAVLSSTAVDKLAVHCHDTYGMAIANIYTALQMGIAVVDSSVAGLGGCPYANGASGNVATEDLVFLLDGLGIEHGINRDKLVDTGEFISRQLQRPNGSKAGIALGRKRDRDAAA